MQKINFDAYTEDDAEKHNATQIQKYGEDFPFLFVPFYFFVISMDLNQKEILDGKIIQKKSI